MNTNWRLQWQLLEYFAAYAPDLVGGNDFTQKLGYETLLSNLSHLALHGLLDNRFRNGADDQAVWLCSRITSRGLALLNAVNSLQPSCHAEGHRHDPAWPPHVLDLAPSPAPVQLALFALPEGICDGRQALTDPALAWPRLLGWEHTVLQQSGERH